MKYAYITLLSSENYLDAVLVLKKSLEQVKSQYELIVAVTDNLKQTKIESILLGFNLIIEWIKPLNYNDKVQKENQNHSVLNTASKLQIFSLHQYDKLVYIDADTMILQNIDDLFEKPDGTMYYDPDEKNQGGSDYGFTALMVFVPKNHDLEFYIKLSQSCYVFDGDLLGRYWKFCVLSDPIHQISPNYLVHYHPKLTYSNNIKAIHFCNEKKPWLHYENYDYFPNNNFIIILYKNYLSSIKQIKEIYER